MNAPMPKNATSQASATVLPEEAVERIFRRMTLIFGAGRVSSMSAGLGTSPAECAETLKAYWAEGLAGFSDKLLAIKYALDALENAVTRDSFPPTMGEFRNLCRQQISRLPDATPQLPFRADPDKAKEASSRLMAQLTGKSDDYDPLLWAKRPKSQKAMDAVISGASRSDKLAEILADLRTNGICNAAGKLLKRYKGQGQWVTA